ncbi:MAG TPA: hypothetical protein PKZ14_04860 [Chitinophagales bacterium]|nr:hypothetical protein [Chitinophagales bacterium]
MRKHGYPADFKYVIMNPLVSIDNKLGPFDQFVIKIYNMIKSISLSAQEDFGLEKTNCRVENVPIRIAGKTHIEIKRED